jgi:hypothetical protein
MCNVTVNTWSERISEGNLQCDYDGRRETFHRRIFLRIYVRNNVLLFPRDKRDEAGLCNVAKGRASCCIIIIKKPRNLAEKFRMILWLEVDCMCARTTMLLANAQVPPNIACAVDW